MASEALRRTSSTQQSESEQGSLMMTSSNVSRLVEKLSKMRGAALKLGQFMSIQGEGYTDFTKQGKGSQWLRFQYVAASSGANLPTCAEQCTLYAKLANGGMI